MPEKKVTPHAALKLVADWPGRYGGFRNGKGNPMAALLRRFDKKKFLPASALVVGLSLTTALAHWIGAGCVVWLFCWPAAAVANALEPTSWAMDAFGSLWVALLLVPVALVYFFVLLLPMFLLTRWPRTKARWITLQILFFMFHVFGLMFCLGATFPLSFEHDHHQIIDP